MRKMSLPVAVFFAVALISVAQSPAQAQYFGRNKVQYKDFKFEVLKTEHFDIYYYPEEQESAARVSRMAERWYARLSQVFSHDMKSRQPLVIYASHPDFEQTNVVSGSSRRSGSPTNRARSQARSAADAALPRRS